MRRPHLWRHRAAAAVFTLTVAACFVLFLPADLGGAATYLTTHGTSMQPRFHTGDLAIAKPVQQYRVGDIAVYRSHTLHTLVMHRIIRREGSHYVFKGDNNTWTDKDRPTAPISWASSGSGCRTAAACSTSRTDTGCSCSPSGCSSSSERPASRWPADAAAGRPRRAREGGIGPGGGDPQDEESAEEAGQSQEGQGGRHAPPARETPGRGAPRLRRMRPRSRSAARSRSRAATPGTDANTTTRHTRTTARHRIGGAAARGARSACSGSARCSSPAPGALGCFLVVGGFAWTKAPTHRVGRPIAYKNRAALTYTATVPAGPVYGTRRRADRRPRLPAARLPRRPRLHVPLRRRRGARGVGHRRHRPRR